MSKLRLEAICREEEIREKIIELLENSPIHEESLICNCHIDLKYLINKIKEM